MRRAFTMLEVVFVIVIIGILATIALPKLSATRDDATITKAINTLASVRASISSEVQKRVLRGDFTPISNLGGDSGDDFIFDYFDGNKSNRVLEYPPYKCGVKKDSGCWKKLNKDTYAYVMPDGSEVRFKLENNHFDCDYNYNKKGCGILEH
ncbi:MAG: prepilin-type N-terminal cleavage/methylation domain-containing protein [Epsilonproteobacteria bacterium]|nr:prepilin-type N-terminal cleavage/methylation domain-containing protein [Campylobacterota bacterium]